MFGDSDVFSSFERTSTITPPTPTVAPISNTAPPIQSVLSKDAVKNLPDTTTATLPGKKDKSPTPTPTPVAQPQARVTTSPLVKEESFFGDSSLKFENAEFIAPPDVKSQALAHPFGFGTPENQSSLFGDSSVNFGPSDFSSFEPAIATDKNT